MFFFICFIYFGLIVIETVNAEAKHFFVPFQEERLYLAMSEHGETVVTYAGKGSDFRPGDYITHADGVKLMTGGIEDILTSGVKEAIVPIVDDDDVQYDGNKILGFVMIKVVMPRKLSARRGEIGMCTVSP